MGGGLHLSHLEEVESRPIAGAVQRNNDVLHGRIAGHCLVEKNDLPRGMMQLTYAAIAGEAPGTSLWSRDYVRPYDFGVCFGVRAAHGMHITLVPPNFATDVVPKEILYPPLRT